MAIIEKKTIISPEAENFADNLLKQYDSLIQKNKELVDTAKQLQKAYQEVNKSSDGSEAKKLIQINNELIKTNQLLIKTDIEIEKVNQAKQKTEQSAIKTKKDQIALERQEEIIKQRALKRIQDESSAYRKLTSELNSLRSKYKDLAAEEKSATKEAQSMLVQIQKLDSKVKNIDASVGQFQRNVGNYGSALSKIGSQISMVFAGIGVNTIINLGKDIINTRAEFQKFSIVLENTLGSSGKAEQALKMVEEFAAKTPFSVQELTASFVKLANQGFQPTLAEMTKLGDLASSTGKGFDQLTEAIIDAGTFEFERLKEFGIRAKKEGDKITFTFKNQETVVKANTAEIQKYILSLGELPGVMGANEKIAQGLTGQISNLGDSWDRLLNSTGKIIEQPVSKALGLISESVGNLANDLNNANDKSNTFTDRVRSWIDVIGRANPVFSFLVEKLTAISWLDEKMKKTKAENAKLEKDRINSMLDEKTIENAKEVGRLRAQNEIALKKLNDTQTKSNEVKETYNKKSDNEISRLKALNEEKEKLIKKNEELFEIQKSYEALQGQQFGQRQDEELNAAIKFQEEEEAALDAIKEKYNQKEIARIDATLEKEKEVLTAKKELTELFISESTQYIKDLSDFAIDDRLNKQKDAAKAEEQILKDKLDKGLINETQYQRAISDLNRKTRENEAKAEKKKALFDIAINTAVAAIKALATGAPPFNWINAAKITAEGFIKGAFVAAQPLPKFAKGEVGIKGKSHAQGGIIAEIEGGESVINKKATAKSKETLEAINKGIFTDADMVRMKKQSETANLLQRLNKTSEKMLTAMGNAVYQYTENGVIYTVFADGSKVHRQTNRPILHG